MTSLMLSREEPFLLRDLALTENLRRPSPVTCRSTMKLTDLALTEKLTPPRPAPFRSMGMKLTDLAWVRIHQLMRIKMLRRHRETL